MTMGGKKIATKTVISDRTPTSYTLTGYANDGSGEKKTMTIKFTKKEPEATPAKKSQGPATGSFTAWGTGVSTVTGRRLI